MSISREVQAGSHTIEEEGAIIELCSRVLVYIHKMEMEVRTAD